MVHLCRYSIASTLHTHNNSPIYFRSFFSSLYAFQGEEDGVLVERLEQILSLDAWIETFDF